MKRKIVSLLLLCSIVFGCISVPSQIIAAGADTVTISEKADLLKKLINLPGEATTGNSPVQRKYYALSLAYLLGKTFEVSENFIETQFYDVYGKDVYTQAIEYLSQQNIVEANKEGMFLPDENITYEDAVKMLVNALGYAKLTEGIGAESQASKIGLLKGVTRPDDGLLSGDMLVLLFYNALETEIVSLETISGDKSEYSVDQTLLEGVLGIEYTKGVVTQTPYTGLTDEQGCSKGTISVDNENYICSDENLINYLGYSVKIYYKEEKNEKEIVAWNVINNDDMIKIDSDSLIAYSDFTITYLNESDKERNVTLDKGVKVIYNGKLSDSFNEDMLKPGIGSVTLLKAESNNYDIMIIEQYKNYLVASVDNVNRKIYSYDCEEVLDLSDNTNDYFITDVSGMQIDLEDIVTQQVMSVAKSRDGKYIKIIVSSASVSGSVTSTGTDDYGNATISIDDEEYRVSHDFNKDMPKTNTGIRAFLDCHNRIFAYIMNSSADGWNAGYVIKIYKNDGEERYNVKMLLSDNLIADIPLKDKVYVNEERYNQTVIDICEDLFNGESARRQLIRYKTNTDGQIIRIETAKEEGNKDSLLRATELKSRIYRQTSRSFAYETFISDKTMVFIVPEETTPLVIGDKRNFKTADISKFVDKYNYKMQAYTVGDDMTDAYAVVVTEDSTKTSQNIEDWRTMSAVTSISKEIDDYDEIITKVELQEGSKVTELIIEQAALEGVWFGSNTGAFAIEKGDTIRYKTNSAGNIDLIELIFDASEKKYAKPRSSDINSTFTCPYSFSYGMAVKRAKDAPERIYIDYNYDKPTSNIVIIPIESFTTTIVDFSNNKPVISGGNPTEQIKTKDIYGSENASMVIFRTELGSPMTAVIYNY